jgi:hypothetical protein
VYKPGSQLPEDSTRTTLKDVSLEQTVLMPLTSSQSYLDPLSPDLLLSAEPSNA